MTTDILPFPFDPWHPLREANLAWARKIYEFALKQAERSAQKRQEAASSAMEPSAWPQKLDLCVIAVQPVQPSQKLLSSRELQKRAHSLRNGNLGRFFSGRDVQVPDGVLFSHLIVSREHRELQILFDNGLVCHMGGIQAKPNGALPRLHLPFLVQHVANALQVAHHLHATSALKGDMSLFISLENLGEHSVEPLVWGGFLHDYDLALIENWTWQYMIPQETFEDLPSLGSFTATIIEELCWAFGDYQVNEQVVSTLAQQLGLQLKS